MSKLHGIAQRKTCFQKRIRIVRCSGNSIAKTVWRRQIRHAVRALSEFVLQLRQFVGVAQSQCAVNCEHYVSIVKIPEIVWFDKNFIIFEIVNPKNVIEIIAVVIPRIVWRTSKRYSVNRIFDVIQNVIF